MEPTFLQKRRPAGRLLRLSLALIGLAAMFIGCIIALSTILVDRELTTLHKGVFITGMLLGVLLSIGLVERLKR
ncbi:hypothetical protein [Spirosoma arcticum]